jgi:hypothetical protein
MSKYGLYDVVRNGYKFIHYDVTDKARFFIVIFHSIKLDFFH